MQLERLSERVWIYPFEQERDRPNLGYIRGEKWSLAVDAGHSAAHVGEFYRALEAAGLPLPALTVLTHWHWDHTLGMHAANGLCLANARTKDHLAALQRKIAREGEEALFSLEESIRREYACGQRVRVSLPDMTFAGGMALDAGNCPVRIIEAEAPHTDDSTLILLPEEKILFLGDAACDVFSTGEKDAVLCQKLADTIRSTGASIVMEGHWTPQTPGEMIADLLSDASQA